MSMPTNLYPGMGYPGQWMQISSIATTGIAQVQTSGYYGAPNLQPQPAPEPELPSINEKLLLLLE